MNGSETKHVWYREISERLQEYSEQQDAGDSYHYEDLEEWPEQTEPINYHKDPDEPMTCDPKLTDREVLLHYYQEMLLADKQDLFNGSKVCDSQSTETINNSHLIAEETRNTESTLDTPSSSPSAGGSDIENTSPKRVNTIPTSPEKQTEAKGTTDAPGSPQELILSSGSEQGSYPCPHCDKHFAYTGNLKRHIKMHHGEYRPYKCSLCVKRFWGSDSLEQHAKRVHSKDKPYACAHCEKKYSVCYDLQKHVRSVHGKDIDWEVSVPSKSLSEEDVGRDRKKVTGIKTVHLGQLQHKCKFCNRGFATFNGLGVHLKMHFRCKVCGKGFNTQESLKTHAEKAQHIIPGGQEYVL